MAQVNKFKQAFNHRGAIRYQQWKREGIKDGMCNHSRALGGVPKLYREAYAEGQVEGQGLREVA